MLLELHIENLAVIPRADLELSPGLNVITGETGAGKTILAHAISLLLGARADTGLIRPGAAAASVEAVFTVPPGCFADLEETLDVPADEYLVVRRQLSRDGRSRAFAGGHTVTLSVLGQLTGRLLEFSAQHEQRRLMMASHQLDILDSFAGPAHLVLRDEYRLAFARRAELLERLEEMSLDTTERSREAELLRFQLAEIEAAGLAPGEDGQLEQERRRLAHARELEEAAGELAACLGAGENTEAGPMDAIAAATARLEASAGIDRELDAIAGRLQASFYELQEAGRAARDFAGCVQSDPARLAEVEERLDLIGQLMRKYGDSVEAVLAYAADAAGRLERLVVTESDRSAIMAELAEVEREALDLALKLRRARLGAAAGLEAAAGAHLQELAFSDCGFTIMLSGARGEAADGPLEPGMLTGSGADGVEFYVRLNQGMPTAALRETASGGELSRIMLAIKSAVSAAGEVATLVFDEIDAGIGGETGGAVGAKLKGLAGRAQIICITHLPQIACFAGAHFSVTKEVARGKTVTSVACLEEEEITGELCRMMGSSSADDDARAHARSLLERGRMLT